MPRLFHKQVTERARPTRRQVLLAATRRLRRARLHYGHGTANAAVSLKQDAGSLPCEEKQEDKEIPIPHKE